MIKSITGLRATSQVHIGNYFGAISNLDSSYENFLLIANLHSLTDEISQEGLMLLGKLLFSYNGYLYIQSNHPQVTYLSWPLTCDCPVGELLRMTQYKSQKDKQNISAGYLYYPLLMAADILITDASRVVVGVDQKQHIEFARNRAQAFNNKYGYTFTIPEYIESKAPKILNLRSNDKMSKSKGDQNGVIFISDTPDQIQYKIKIAKTDSGLMPIDILNDKRESIKNLCLIFSIVTGKSYNQIEQEYKNTSFSTFKSDLTDALISFTSQLQTQISNISNDMITKRLQENQQQIDAIFDKKIQDFRLKLKI